MKRSTVHTLMLLITIASGLSTAVTKAATTPWQKADHIKVRMLTDVDALGSGSVFYAGFEFVPDEHWHVYWRNPGDSGMPISIDWDLPEGMESIKIVWPIPKKIPFGPLTNFGYEGQLVLPVQLKSSRVAAENVQLKARVNWLVCKDSCIPGSASFSLALAQGKLKQDIASQKLLQPFLSQEAASLPLISGSLVEQEHELTLELYAAKAIFKEAKNIQFFPINESLFESGAETKIRWKNNVITLTQKKSESFYKIPKIVQGLLVVDENKALEFTFNTQP